MLSIPCAATFPRTRNLKKCMIYFQTILIILHIIYVKSIQNLLHYPLKYFVSKNVPKKKQNAITVYRYVPVYTQF